MTDAMDRLVVGTLVVLINDRIYELMKKKHASPLSSFFSEKFTEGDEVQLQTLQAGRDVLKARMELDKQLLGK